MADEMERQLEEAIREMEQRQADRSSSTQPGNGNPQSRTGGSGIQIHGIYNMEHMEGNESIGGFQPEPPQREPEIPSGFDHDSIIGNQALESFPMEEDTQNTPVIDQSMAIPIPGGHSRGNRLSLGNGSNGSFLSGLLEGYRWLNLLLGIITVAALLYILFHWKAVTDAIFSVVLQIVVALAELALILVVILVLILFIQMRRRR